MTVIGKILTFLVFFLSLVFLGFAVSVNMLNKDTKTGQSWRTVAQNLRDKTVPQMEKDLEQKDVDITRLRGDMDKITKDQKVARENFDKELKQERDLRATAVAEGQQAKTEFMNSQVAVKAATDELDKRRQETQGLHTTIKDKDTRIAGLIADSTKKENEKIQALVSSDTFMKRAMGLEKQVTDLTKALEQERLLAADKAFTTGVGRDTIRRPPPDDVKGIIKSVTADGLVSISIGSDAGLLKGHTLEVFRLEPKAEYFGALQIVEVGPHEAVGKLLSTKFFKRVQVNDQVASKILPSLPSARQ